MVLWLRTGSEAIQPGFKSQLCRLLAEQSQCVIALALGQVLPSPSCLLASKPLIAAAAPTLLPRWICTDNRALCALSQNEVFLQVFLWPPGKNGGNILAPTRTPPFSGDIALTPALPPQDEDRVQLLFAVSFTKPFAGVVSFSRSHDTGLWDGRDCHAQAYRN